ncbi:hypothetical protein CIB48_g1071 [Xylaria polymorpha]|nr:hypothetical protein CIB48_g1071 [Xylaria polymorpha]
MRKCGNATTLKGIVVPISHPSTCVLVTGNRLGDEATIGCFLKVRYPYYTIMAFSQQSGQFDDRVQTLQHHGWAIQDGPDGTVQVEAPRATGLTQSFGK